MAVEAAEILARAAARLPHDIGRRVARDPLSTVLREATRGAHEEAESGPLESALADGRLDPEVYADLLAQTWAVHQAIEAIAPTFVDDPTAGPFVRPEVFRAANVERDLAHYWGPAWRARVELLPETDLATSRIRTVAASDPIAWIAHAHTRHLTALSDGPAIEKAVTRAYGLQQEGRWLYSYDLPVGIDSRTWKHAYRQLLDVLELDEASAARLVREALVAQQLDMARNDALVERHGTVLRSAQIP